RFFVAYEAKLGNSETQGQSEVGARYFEGTAAGAVLLGRAPTVPSFREDFPWPDAVVDVGVDGANVKAILDDLATSQDGVERIGLRNAVHTLRRHDWGHRWRAILQRVAISPRPALAERLGALETLASYSDPASSP